MITDIGKLQTQENPIIRIAQKLGIYSMLVQKSPGSLISSEIATKTGVEQVLMDRIMRNLGALAHVDEEAGASAVAYTANKFTRALISDKGIHGMIFSYVCKKLQRSDYLAGFFDRLRVTMHRCQVKIA